MYENDLIRKLRAKDKLKMCDAINWKRKNYIILIAQYFKT